MDINKLIYGCPKIHFKISNDNFGYPLLFCDILNSFLDILKSNYAYPKFSMTFGYPKMYFRIS